jgi:hypothetical protein
MKKGIVAICLVVILFSLLFCGCTEEEDYLMHNIPTISVKDIDVTVHPSVTVERFNSSSEISYPVANLQVTFQIQKTAGQTFIFKEYTNQNGYAACTEVGYNLYKDNVITVYYTADGVSTSKSLTFDSINEPNLGTQEYAWSPHGLIKFYE